MERIVWIALGVWLALMNLLSFASFGIDKRRARLERFRISEARLLTLAALGGALGALIGMRCFHHKTRKWKFRLPVPLFLVLHLVLLALLWGWLNGGLPAVFGR